MTEKQRHGIVVMTIAVAFCAAWGVFLAVAITNDLEAWAGRSWAVRVGWICAAALSLGTAYVYVWLLGVIIKGVNDEQE